MNNENSNIYTDLTYKTITYFNEHPIMIYAVGLSIGVSIIASCTIITGCLIVDKKLKGEM